MWIIQFTLCDKLLYVNTGYLMCAEKLTSRQFSLLHNIPKINEMSKLTQKCYEHKNLKELYLLWNYNVVTAK